MQEAIIRLVSKPNEKTGNLFMVGDIKQSIYRFRLAEPTLFISKYKRYTSGNDAGLVIDLNQNFRSRKEILSSTNMIFEQIMDEDVGEMPYDKQAALYFGASYYEEKEITNELLLIDMDEEKVTVEDEEEEDLTKIQLEARMIAKKIGELMEKQEKVFDKSLKAMRPIKFRDIVILSRSGQVNSPIVIEELKQFGIPAYADLSSGYFEAMEVAIMLNVLTIIDNPYQDIPLASVLRSPIVGLTGEELALIRIEGKERASYYEAVKTYLKIRRSGSELYTKLDTFMKKIYHYRDLTQQMSLSELIWFIYQDTGYYDFVGGMPNGVQRQANLRLLYDRARHYEQTSFRGLFRFLRFIERLKEKGSDLGVARALGEQEDVVRILTIHKSKGLEFPVVFIHGLTKQFNEMDTRKDVLLHKNLGIGTYVIDPEQRMKYETLPFQLVKKAMRKEMIAEEMRILYVALTRAREKLYLVGAVKKVEDERKKWTEALTTEQFLAKGKRQSAKSYLDWIVPSMMRHQSGIETFEIDPSFQKYDEPQWNIEIVPQEELFEAKREKNAQEDWLEKIQRKERLVSSEKWKEDITKQLSYGYPYVEDTQFLAKQSVTELKRNQAFIGHDGGDEFVKPPFAPIVDRPLFMQQKTLTSTERGTLMHLVMQHLPIESINTEEDLEQFIQQLIEKEVISLEQEQWVNRTYIMTFLESDLGKRMRQNVHTIKRELPFSYTVKAKEIYKEIHSEEKVLIQGVIDAIFEENGQYIMVDYKTDNISDRFKGDFQAALPVLKKRYETQVRMYREAVEKIVQVKINESYLYFFDGGYLVNIENL